MPNNKKSARRLWLARAGLLALQTGFVALEVTAFWMLLGIPQYPVFWLLYAAAAVVTSLTGMAMLPVIRRYEDWLRRLEDRHQAVPVPYIQRHRHGA